MNYCENTRKMLENYKRETDAQIFALQQKVYQLQSQMYSLELERYFENYTPKKHEQET